MNNSDQKIRMFATNSTVINQTTSHETQLALSKSQLIYSSRGLVVGALCMVLGVVLFYLGISGSTEWTLNIAGYESKVIDAAPGTVLFLCGCLIIYLTKYEFRHKV
ncbi:hypothetical protein VCSRO66_3401 [Vibrio cholerae]|nr:hypothetical protein VNVC001_30690 [Vibrio cholerae]GHW44495.1 hypothetical protein VCSRO10_3651 [Vibrio cholerae]GHX82664.1 hypothetical protein VCSRO66_3401 [Vibrio cholerae]GHZ28417.1 hypothetical protein VCSRO172_3368 [Vibrio cholerae]